jgi:DNA invertase Pin-like site-specific DNA recombinase
MKIGYIRVSSMDQNATRQEIIMQELGAEQIFIDRLSGKDTKRPELQKMLSFARKGDTVIVESISRFARNTRDLLTLIDLLTAKGVDFVSKKENINTTTPTGKFMLTVFGAVAELEREYILQRQKEGIAIAIVQGKYKGRKRIENVNFDAVYDKWQSREVTAVEAMKILNMKKSTFYRRVSEKS